MTQLNRREWFNQTAISTAGLTLAHSVQRGTAAETRPAPLPETQDVLLLAIDDESLPLRKNVCLHLSRPKVRPEPVLTPSPFESTAPDNLAAHFYGTVLQDGGKFRMWYYACHWGKSGDWIPHLEQQLARQGKEQLFQGPLCYAESDDGIVWTKPELGQVLFKGSRANNALALPHAVVSGAIVIKDEAEPDPARRYKMTYQFFPHLSDPPIPEYGRQPTVALAVSADGLRWNVIGIPFVDQFVEPSSFLKHDGQYVVHYQAAGNLGGYFSEGGASSGRTGVARLTTDFGDWPDLLAEGFALVEPEEKSLRGLSGAYDQVHLGVGAASFGNVCVGLYGIWHNADFDKKFDEISCDFGLLVSSDGVKFREPVKGHRFLRREESLATPVPGRHFNTILCQANGILNVGEETRIYHGRWRNANNIQDKDDLRYYSGEVALATLPRDRWGSLRLNPDETSGSVCSAAMTLPQTKFEIELNADAARKLRVEVIDKQFQPVPEFSGVNSGRVELEGGLNCQVKWPQQSISSLAGKMVRLLIHFEKQDSFAPALYAVLVKPIRSK